MSEWSRFELDGYTFIASLPDKYVDEQVFTICVMRGDATIRSETIPLIHEPIFGPDVDDVASLNGRVEEIITELGLGKDDEARKTR
jgi:hypothetical protein